MDFGIVAGDTDKTIYVRLRDSTTGLAKTGLAFNSAGAVASYVLPGAARAAITLATQTVAGAHADGGFVEVDATNCKGLYRLDLPDAAIASGAYSLISIEFDGIIEETVIVPLSLRKGDVRQFGGTNGTFSGGRPEVNTTHAAGTAWGSGAITAASIASDAITAAKIATGAIDADAIADNAIDAGAIATGAITAAKFAAGAIDAAAIATDAIDADALAANAVTEIQNGLATSTALQTVDDEIATIDANVDTLLARITSTLFAGITSLAEWLGLMAGKQAGDATARTELRGTGAGSGTFDETTDSLEAIKDAGGGGPTAADIADAVWEEAIADHSGTSGSTAEALAAAGGAGDPWITALPGSYTSGQAGHIIGTYLTAAVATASELAKVPKSDGTATWNATALASIQQEATDALNAYDPPTNAEMTARTLAAADYATNADLDALITTVGVAGAGLTAIITPLGTVDTVVDSILVDTTQIKADLPSRPTKNVELANFMFLMVDETDLNTPETGVTVTATISKDGGAFAACTNAVSEVSGGWYKITLTSTEMNADSIAVKFTGTGCAQRNVAIRTQP